MYTPSASGGHALYSHELLTALTENSHNQYAFELVTSVDLEEQFKSGPYDIHPVLRPLLDRSRFRNKLSWIGSRLTHYARREWQFLNWLRQRPDISAVHFQEWAPWLVAPMIRRVRSMGKKVFQTIHNVVPHRYPMGVPKTVVEGWLRTAGHLTDGMFVHTDRLATELSTFLGEPHPPIHVVPHGVWNISHTSGIPSIQERLTWKKLLFFGQIRQNKGLDLLLTAAEKLPEYSITIAGVPHEQQYFNDAILPRIARLRAAGAKIDLRDRFIPDNETSQLFATHSAIVMPYTEGFVAQSGVVFLALAHEIPAVASEAGGLRELFEQCKIGVNYRGSSPEALADAIRALHSFGRPDELLREIRSAKRRYSWEAAALATLAGYADAFKERRETHDCVVDTTPAR